MCTGMENPGLGKGEVRTVPPAEPQVGEAVRHQDRRRLLDRAAPMLRMFINEVVAVSRGHRDEAVVVRGGVGRVGSHDAGLVLM